MYEDLSNKFGDKAKARIRISANKVIRSNKSDVEAHRRSSNTATTEKAGFIKTRSALTARRCDERRQRQDGAGKSVARVCT